VQSSKRQPSTNRHSRPQVALYSSTTLKGPSPKTHLVALTEPEGRYEPLLVLRGTWSHEE